MAIITLEDGTKLEADDGLPDAAYDEIVEDYMSSAQKPSSTSSLSGMLGNTGNALEGFQRGLGLSGDQVIGTLNKLAPNLRGDDPEASLANDPNAVSIPAPQGMFSDKPMGLGDLGNSLMNYVKGGIGAVGSAGLTLPKMFGDMVGADTSGIDNIRAGIASKQEAMDAENATVGMGAGADSPVDWRAPHAPWQPDQGPLPGRQEFLKPPKNIGEAGGQLIDNTVLTAARLAKSLVTNDNIAMMANPLTAAAAPAAFIPPMMQGAVDSFSKAYNHLFSTDGERNIPAAIDDVLEGVASTLFAKSMGKHLSQQIAAGHVPEVLPSEIPAGFAANRPGAEIKMGSKADFDRAQLTSGMNPIDVQGELLKRGLTSPQKSAYQEIPILPEGPKVSPFEPPILQAQKPLIEPGVSYKTIEQTSKEMNQAKEADLLKVLLDKELDKKVTREGLRKEAIDRGMLIPEQFKAGPNRPVEGVEGYSPKEMPIFLENSKLLDARRASKTATDADIQKFYKEKFPEPDQPLLAPPKNWKPYDEASEIAKHEKYISDLEMKVEKLNKRRGRENNGILQDINRMGGIKYDGIMDGELRHLGIKNMKKGQSLDVVARNLEDYGWPEKMSSYDLLELIQRDQKKRATEGAERVNTPEYTERNYKDMELRKQLDEAKSFDPTAYGRELAKEMELNKARYDEIRKFSEREAKEGPPHLISAKNSGDAIYLTFDKGSRIPTEAELKKYVSDQGFKSSVSKFSEDFLHSAEGVRKFHIRILDEHGRNFRDKSGKLFKSFSPDGEFFKGESLKSLRKAEYIKSLEEKVDVNDPDFFQKMADIWNENPTLSLLKNEKGSVNFTPQQMFDSGKAAVRKVMSTLARYAEKTGEKIGDVLEKVLMYASERSKNIKDKFVKPALPAEWKKTKTELNAEAWQKSKDAVDKAELASAVTGKPLTKEQQGAVQKNSYLKELQARKIDDQPFKGGRQLWQNTSNRMSDVQDHTGVPAGELVNRGIEKETQLTHEMKYLHDMDGISDVKKNLAKAGITPHYATELMHYVESDGKGNVTFNPKGYEVKRGGKVVFTQPNFKGQTPSAAAMVELTKMRHAFDAKYHEYIKSDNGVEYHGRFVPRMAKIPLGETGNRLNPYEARSKRSKSYKDEPMETDMYRIIERYNRDIAKDKVFGDNWIEKTQEASLQLQMRGYEDTLAKELDAAAATALGISNKALQKMRAEDIIKAAQAGKDLDKMRQDLGLDPTQMDLVVTAAKKLTYAALIARNIKNIKLQALQFMLTGAPEVGAGNALLKSIPLIRTAADKAALQSVETKLRNAVHDPSETGQTTQMGPKAKAAVGTLNAAAIPGEMAQNFFDKFTRESIFLGGRHQFLKAKGASSVFADMAEHERLAIRKILKTKGLDAAANEYGLQRSKRTATRFSKVDQPAWMRDLPGGGIAFTSFSRGAWSSIRQDVHEIRRGNKAAAASLAKKLLYPLILSGITSMALGEDNSEEVASRMINYSPVSSLPRLGDPSTFPLFGVAANAMRGNSETPSKIPKTLLKEALKMTPTTSAIMEYGFPKKGDTNFFKEPGKIIPAAWKGINPWAAKGGKTTGGSRPSRGGRGSRPSR